MESNCVNPKRFYLMKPILLALVSITLLVTCAQRPQYAWHHPNGLGEKELQRDQKACKFFAEKNIPPSDFNNFPYLEQKPYDGYPFYGYSEPIERQADYFYWHREFYQQGFHTFAYLDDMTMACMQGNGWYRVEFNPATNAAAAEARQLATKLRELTGL